MVFPSTTAKCDFVVNNCCTEYLLLLLLFFFSIFFFDYVLLLLYFCKAMAHVWCLCNMVREYFRSCTNISRARPYSCEWNMWGDFRMKTTFSLALTRFVFSSLGLLSLSVVRSFYIADDDVLYNICFV